MGTTRLITRASFLGIALTLLTILFFIDPLSAPHFPWDDPYSPFEFTDVRIVKLHHPVSPSATHGIHRVTIHKEFNLNFPWCHRHNPMALPCLLSPKNQDQEPPLQHITIHRSITSL